MRSRRGGTRGFGGESLYQSTLLVFKERQLILRVGINNDQVRSQEVVDWAQKQSLMVLGNNGINPDPSRSYE